MPRDKTEAHEKIIAAAVREFMIYGFENASMRRIAAEVGLTVGALYRHFPNKEEMFAALVEPTIDELMAKYQAFVEQGYEVMKCGNGRDALEIAEKGGFDLILLDIMLPGLNGLEVLRRLRTVSDVPVILLTARDAVMDKVSGLDAGAVRRIMALILAFTSRMLKGLVI